jgi:hypothetical protein
MAKPMPPEAPVTSTFLFRIKWLPIVASDWVVYSEYLGERAILVLTLGVVGCHGLVVSANSM